MGWSAPEAAPVWGFLVWFLRLCLLHFAFPDVMVTRSGSGEGACFGRGWFNCLGRSVVDVIRSSLGDSNWALGKIAQVFFSHTSFGFWLSVLFGL